MHNISNREYETSALPFFSALQRERQTVSQKCINCTLCQKECKFLRHYGKPKEFVDSFDIRDKTHLAVSFECSLCRLCEAVCPQGVKPADLFLEMRREAVLRGNGIFAEHNGMVAYERRGTSKRFTWYGLPDGCDTIFFPGCTLPGTRPDKTLALFERIQQKIPSLGIVLDCCTKPSHDLGRQAFFEAMFQEMKDYLINNGIKKVLVPCPNCYKVFDQYGGDLSVLSVYDLLAEDIPPLKKRLKGTVTVHDPCALRFAPSTQTSVRSLIDQLGLTIQEMPHSGKTTLCCGEGGSVGPISPELSKRWSSIRKQEYGGNRIITYCAGCANILNPSVPAIHLLDLYFEPEVALAGKAKVSKAPGTYWNRLKLKQQLKNRLTTALTRERTFSTKEWKTKYGTLIRFVIVLAVISSLIIWMALMPSI